MIWLPATPRVSLSMMTSSLVHCRGAYARGGTVESMRTAAVCEIQVARHTEGARSPFVTSSSRAYLSLAASAARCVAVRYRCASAMNTLRGNNRANVVGFCSSQVRATSSSCSASTASFAAMLRHRRNLCDSTGANWSRRLKLRLTRS